MLAQAQPDHIVDVNNMIQPAKDDGECDECSGKGGENGLRCNVCGKRGAT